MSKIRTMSAGASGRQYNVNINGNQGGGNSKQGLPPTATNFFMVPGGSNNQYNRAVGQNRDVVFCMNQLGGVGRGRTQFGSGSRDGVGKTGGCGTDETNENIQKLIDYFKSTHSTYDLVLAGNNTSLEQELSNCCSGYTPATGDFIHISEIIYLIQLPTAIRRLIEAVNVVSNNLSHSFNRQDNGCGTWLGLQRLTLFTNQGTAASILQTCNFGTTTWYGLSVYTAPEPNVYTTPIYVDYNQSLWPDQSGIKKYDATESTQDTFQLEFSLWADQSSRSYDYVRFDSGSQSHRMTQGSTLCNGLIDWLGNYGSSGGVSAGYTFDANHNSGTVLKIDWSNALDANGYANTSAICDQFYIELSDGAGGSIKIGILEHYRYGTASSSTTHESYTYNNHQTFAFNSTGIFQPSTNTSNTLLTKLVNNYTWLDYTNSQFCLIQTDLSDSTYSPASTELVKYTYFSGTIEANDFGNYVGTVNMPEQLHSIYTPSGETMNITLDSGGDCPIIVLAANCTGDLYSEHIYTDVSCNIGCAEKTRVFSNGTVVGCGGDYTLSDAPVYFPSGWALYDYDDSIQTGILGCEVTNTSNSHPDDPRQWNYIPCRAGNPWMDLFKSYYTDTLGVDITDDICLSFTFQYDPSANMVAFGWGMSDDL